jgi:hypothetical protein
MLSFRSLAAAASLLLFLCVVKSQSIVPTNQKSDLQDARTSPRYLLGSTDVGLFTQISLAPLGPDIDIPYNDFSDSFIIGPLFLMTNSNSTEGKLAYISCEPVPNENDTYAYNLFYNAITKSSAQYVILYSTSSNHCVSTNLAWGPNIQAVFTVVGDPTGSAALADLVQSTLEVTIVPDLASYVSISSTSNAPTTSTSTSQSSASSTLSLYTSLPSSDNFPDPTASSSQTGVIVGAALGGLAGLIILMLLLCFYIWQRKKMLARSSQPVTYKPEMDAAPSKQEGARAGTPISASQNQTVVQRSTSPKEIMSEDVSDTIEERGRQRTRSFPPVENASRSEDSVQPITSLPTQSQTSPSSGPGHERAPEVMSPMTQRLLPPATIESPTGSYSAAEADFAVQELGLISMRKRKLAG